MLQLLRVTLSADVLKQIRWGKQEVCDTGRAAAPMSEGLFSAKVEINYNMSLLTLQHNHVDKLIPSCSDVFQCFFLLLF